MNAREFLDHLDQVPHLLDLARRQEKLNYYRVQENLRAQHRREGHPFLYSMPMRHLYRCPQCGKQDTDVLHELEDPRRRSSIKFSELVLHQARFHDVPPDEALASHLMSCLDEVK